MDEQKRATERAQAAAAKKAAELAKIKADKKAAADAKKEITKAAKAKQKADLKQREIERKARVAKSKADAKAAKEAAKADKAAKAATEATREKTPEEIAAAKAAADAKAAKEAEKARKAQAVSAVTEELKPLAKEINERFSLATKLDGKADDHRLAAAIQLEAARQKCEAAGIAFKTWATDNVKGQAYETIRKLVAIGASENPKLALEDLRAKNALANKALRERVAERAKADGAEGEDGGDGSTPEPRARTTRNAEVLVGVDALKAAFNTLKASEKVAFATWAAVEIGAELKTAFDESVPPAPEPDDVEDEPKPGLVRRGVRA